MVGRHHCFSTRNNLPPQGYIHLEDYSGFSTPCWLIHTHFPKVRAYPLEGREQVMCSTVAHGHTQSLHCFSSTLSQCPPSETLQFHSIITFPTFVALQNHLIYLDRFPSLLGTRVMVLISFPQISFGISRQDGYCTLPELNIARDIGTHILKDMHTKCTFPLGLWLPTCLTFMKQGEPLSNSFCNQVHLS